jgi:DNA primase catalytic core
MARIPDAEIERLRNEVPVLRLIAAAGLALEQRGQDYAAHCPFHEEVTASLIVTPGKNLFHCFGCGAAGGPIDWVMKRNGVSFRHAVELLREGVSPGSAEPAKRSTVRALPPPVAFDADDRALLGQVADYYHRSLLEAPEALDYLKARGLGDPELIEAHELGYANRTLGLRLPEKTRKAGAEIRARLERLGVYRESGHEHLNGSLVVPLFDEAGAVVGMYGRKIRDDLRPGTARHLYLPGPHRGLWNWPGIAGSGGEVILTEALLDAMTFWCAGWRNVTAAYGTEGLTAEHLAAFARHEVRRVLIAFDRDEAGDRGAAKVAEMLRDAGIECCRIEFPRGMDANEYALKVTPAAKSLGVLIRKAAWLGHGKPPERGPAPPPEAPESTPPSALAAKEDEAAPASPVLPPADLAAEAAAPETVLVFGDRRWRVRGLARNLAPGVLKVNLLAGIGEAFHVDTLDLYNARARAGFVVQAAAELGQPEAVLKADLGRVLLRLEALQDAAIGAALAPKPVVPAMDEAARAAALDLLRSPDLPGRILADFAACGIVGEDTNKLVGYLAAVSRKLAAPLAVVVQSSSAAGKSSLLDAVLAFVPEEERTQYSAMTGQSLFYMGQDSLKHRILAIAEEAGAARASYALKLLQSEGVLTIASTGSDPKTGNLVTREYRVEGPVALMMTTTAIDLDEELLNRCLVLTVDEDREQTRAIHRLQRQKRTLAGLARKEARQSVLTVHRNAQRLLRPLAVVNPYADQLTFLDGQTRTRRDHEKYLTLIDAIALLHQHQRPVRSVTVEGRAIDYVEVVPADIDLANRLAHEVLGRSLDELPPQTRKLLASVQVLVRDRAQADAIAPGEVRFSRAEVRRHAGLSDTQCRLHLDRLAALEYLLVHRGRRGQSFEYELLFDGEIQDGAPQLAGLIDAAALRAEATTASSRGSEDQFAGASRGHGAPNAAATRPLFPAAKPILAPVAAEIDEGEPEPHPLRANGAGISYLHAAGRAGH